MGRNVILLAGEEDERAAAVTACMRRLWSVEDPQRLADASSKAAADPSAISGVLHELRNRGRLFFGGLGSGQLSLCYAPSALAKRLLFESGAGGDWPARVAKEMEKSTQAIPGALFRLPLFDDDGYVEAFITDWAPFPAACAVAVHPSHPLGDSVQNEPNRWTGTHVRNPLTGDLMAVWTAGWVRPEFGTGAVIVNPAHSAVDLEFARSIGLPIRFGLAPSKPSADPTSWPLPPVVNTGIAVRTGIADGNDALAARRTYLELLEAAGHASSYTDRVLTAITIGSARLRTPITLAAILDDSINLHVHEPYDVLMTTPLDPGSIIVLSTMKTAEVLTMRALHIDVHSSDVKAPTVYIVQSATGAMEGSRSRERDLALIGFAQLGESAALKEKNLQQAQRFYENHTKIDMTAVLNLESRPPKRITSVFSSMILGQLKTSFSELYKIQRDIAKKPDAVSNADRFAYFAAAYVLAAAELPNGYPLSEVLAALAPEN